MRSSNRSSFLGLYFQIIKNAIFIQKNFKSKSSFFIKILSFSPLGSIFSLIFCYKYDKKNNFNYKYDSKYMTILSFLSFFAIIPAFLMLILSIGQWNNFISYWYIKLIPVCLYLIILLTLIIFFNKIQWYHKIPKKYKILISTLPIIFFIIGPILFTIIINKTKKSFNDSKVSNKNISNDLNNSNDNYKFEFQDNSSVSDKYQLLSQLLDDYQKNKISKEEFEQKKQEIL